MESEKIVYLMRGLPSSGKSHTAKQLAGKTGIVCETDEYFYTHLGNDPKRYDYRSGLLEEARRWNFERFKEAIGTGITPIVVDRGNGLNLSTQIYARYAVDNGYDVELKEPESEWWQELRVLLKYKQVTRPLLLQWAEILARMSRSTHRVPAAVIRRRMGRWKFDLTVNDILNYTPQETPSTHITSEGQLTDQSQDEVFGMSGTGTLGETSTWVGEFVLDSSKDMGAVHPNEKIALLLSGDDDQNKTTGDTPSGEPIGELSEGDIVPEAAQHKGKKRAKNK
jgi:hypothetical protein